MSGYAVIDFETTGLWPESHDRAIEVGVVLTDEAGRIEDEWTTLMNPRRDLGPTHIHGITAAQVLQAPEFHQIAPHLVSMLRGRTTVAHNASFDMRFLHHELVRSGYPLLTRPDALCTMRWAGQTIGAAKLSQCCEALEIELSDAHTALADARATAQLLGYLISRCSSAPGWAGDRQRSDAYVWPSATSDHPVTSTGRSVAARPADWWLTEILESTWIPGSSSEEASYLLYLENALLDRSISLTEGEMLVQTARASGISSSRADALHRQYLDALAVEVLADDVITADEQRDLDQVASALRLTVDDIEMALGRALAAKADTTTPETFLRRGDRVVFTGTLTRDRNEWIADLVAVGLASGGITKSTRVVVTPDPDSMSGKAMKARGFGVPLVDEETFAKMFAAYNDGQ